MANVFINLFRYLFRYLWRDIKDKWSHRKQWYGYGVYMFCGLPGYGKTVSMVEYALRIKKRFPYVNIYTNFDCSFADGKINHWKDIINFPSNSMFLLDEIQLTFNSTAWKDFPPELVSLLTMNRKVNKQLLCSAQSFSRVDKNFRLLCMYIIECYTLLGEKGMGRWTFQKWYNPDEYTTDGKNSDMKRHKRAKRYNFIQTEEVRSSYDTKQMLTSLKNVQYVERNKDVSLQV